MSILKIDHQTIYRYHNKVNLGAHQIRIRPIEDHEKRILSFDLNIQPTHRIRWATDQFQNPVGYLEFLKPTQELKIESQLKVQLELNNPFDFILEPYALHLPFQYAKDEFIDLAPYLQPQFPGDQASILQWIQPFLNLERRAKTVDFLTAINRAIPKIMTYQIRKEIGVQSPAHTIHNRSGACRDFAVLLMETARHLGMAARFVSGYIPNIHSNENTSNLARLADGAMHAWTQIYLPGAGWKDFDPTAGILAGNEHLRVAVGRTAEQTSPIIGAYLGNEKLELSFEAHVHVSISA